jgi:hypothetical protein
MGNRASSTVVDIRSGYRDREGENKSCINGIHKLNVDEYPLMSSANQFRCEQCGETFNSLEEFQAHKNTQHVGTA